MKLRRSLRLPIAVLCLTFGFALCLTFVSSHPTSGLTTATSSSLVQTPISNTSSSMSAPNYSPSSTSVVATPTTSSTNKSNNSLPYLYEGSKQRATQAQINAGKVLFITACSTCHSVGAGGSSVAPSLLGRGPAVIDFWVSTGRMPLANPSIQPARKAPKFTEEQTIDIAAYVASLQPGGPLIPNVSGYENASLSEGAQLFAYDCAGCHTITGAGDALAGGAYAPSLHEATPVQIAEAIRTGPANMPKFDSGIISNQELDSIVKYVSTTIQHPSNNGGFGLGGIGPVAEGFVGLLIGVGVMMLFGFWVGDRS